MLRSVGTAGYCADRTNSSMRPCLCCVLAPGKTGRCFPATDHTPSQFRQQAALLPRGGCRSRVDGFRRAALPRRRETDDADRRSLAPKSPVSSAFAARACESHAPAARHAPLPSLPCVGRILQCGTPRRVQQRIVRRRRKRSAYCTGCTRRRGAIRSGFASLASAIGALRAKPAANERSLSEGPEIHLDVTDRQHLGESRRRVDGAVVIQAGQHERRHGIAVRIEHPGIMADSVQGFDPEVAATIDRKWSRVR